MEEQRLYVDYIRVIPNEINGRPLYDTVTQGTNSHFICTIEEINQQAICISDIEPVEEELSIKESNNYTDIENITDTKLYQFCDPFIDEIYTEHTKFDIYENGYNDIYSGRVVITDIFKENHEYHTLLTADTANPKNILIYKALIDFYKHIKFAVIWASKGIMKLKNEDRA